MKNTGKNFERLVTAIHNLEAKDIEVQWDKKINGRQFDIIIRFNAGLYNYLTVIECKDHASSISVKEVEAFVTKSKDAKVNKAIMIASNTYQKGCYLVAQKYDVELLTLSGNIQSEKLSIKKETTPAFNISDISFIKSNGEEYELPKEPSGRLDFLIKNIKMEDGKNKITLEEFLNSLQLKSILWHTTIQMKYTFDFKSTTNIELPLDEGIFEIISISFKCKLINASVQKEKSLDVHIQYRLATIYNLTTTEGIVKKRIRLQNIKLGFDTELEKKRFYEDPQTGFYYYCVDIVENKVVMILVESYQHGQLFGGKFTFDVKDSHNYIEVKDNKIINRLERILKRIRRDIPQYWHK